MNVIPGIEIEYKNRSMSQIAALVVLGILLMLFIYILYTMFILGSQAFQYILDPNELWNTLDSSDTIAFYSVITNIGLSGFLVLIYHPPPARNTIRRDRCLPRGDRDRSHRGVLG
jgi:hypothetical protein